MAGRRARRAGDRRPRARRRFHRVPARLDECAAPAYARARRIRAARDRIEAFIEALAKEATGETDVFLVGGTSAVLVGWRATTVDVDLVMRPESDAMLRAIPALYDFTAQALAKIERGHARDVADVRAMVERGLISSTEMRRQYELVEPQLHRYPAIDPPSFRRALDALFPP